MTAVTKGFASRLGSGAGRALRFFMHDRNVVLRWMKRASLAAVLLLVLVNSVSWLVSVAIWGGIILLAVYGMSIPGHAWSNGDLRVIHEEIERHRLESKGFNRDVFAPYGRDAMGRILNSSGNVDNHMG
ncbi:hypothetical protein [Pseudomonas citronellolis]|uniref:hypothetical protein n=1 Tax=Pseudomonas citronellolis TaxID=53408 RepID=UPI00248ED1BC|nr:hypothetical protein [Pseudomonas citronellolis]